MNEIMDATDFLEQDEEFNTEDSPMLKELGLLVEALKDTQEEIADIEEDLKKLKEKERELSREEIPTLLLSNGMKSIELQEGGKLIVNEKLTCALPKDPVKRKTCLRWIISQNGSGIISNDIIINDPEKSLLEELKKQGIPISKQHNVNAATLKSFVSGLLGIKKGSLPKIELSDIPSELNVFIYKETKIK